MRSSGRSPALFYWWPKIFGRVLDERLGKAQFWLVFIGFNLTFFPQHMLGLMGMPRRIYTYDRHGLFQAYNLISSIGSGIMALGILLFFVNVVKTSRTGRRAPNDPVARRHARVVHDVSTAGAQLRQGPVRHERATAPRPAAPARRASQCLGPVPGCA